MQLRGHHHHVVHLRRGVQRTHLPEGPLEELDLHDRVQAGRRRQRQVLAPAEVLQHHEHRSGEWHLVLNRFRHDLSLYCLLYYNDLLKSDVDLKARHVQGAVGKVVG